MFATRVLSDTALRQTSAGYLIDIRLPWYRALPLSTVDVAALSVDGEPVDLSTIKFQLQDLSLKLDQLADQFSQWWYVLDSAYLLVPGKLTVGKPHQVAVTIGIRPPYIPGFHRLTECQKTLIAEAA